MLRSSRSGVDPLTGRGSVVPGEGAAALARLQRSALFLDYQNAFEATTGLPLVLRAPGSFRTPLQGSKRGNPFCALMTQANPTCAACLQLQQRVEEEARQGPKTLLCYAGLSETAVPVRVGSLVLGYLQTGQVFLRAPTLKAGRDRLRAIPGAEAGAVAREWEAAYFQTRVVTPRQYESTVRLLAIFAEHLATVSNQMLIGRATAESPVIAKIRLFIAEHQSEDLHLGEVARAANMSVFYFCKIFHKAIGLTFTEYLARTRIEDVKRRLLNIQTRVSEAGYAAGFQSLSQFNRVFRRVTGESPRGFRARLHRASGKASRPVILAGAA